MSRKQLWRISFLISFVTRKGGYDKIIPHNQILQLTKELIKPLYLMSAKKKDSHCDNHSKPKYRTHIDDYLSLPKKLFVNNTSVMQIICNMWLAETRNDVG
jgi:hypothetical protein